MRSGTRQNNTCLRHNNTAALCEEAVTASAAPGMKMKNGGTKYENDEDNDANNEIYMLYLVCIAKLAISVDRVCLDKL